MSLAAAVLALASFAAPAYAGPPLTPVQVAHVALGTTLGAVIAGPDGNAWVRVQRPGGAAIGRAAFNGGLRTAAVQEPLSDEQAALGPDGQAWFTSGRVLERSDAAGTVTRSELSEPAGDVIAGGPDGTLWGFENGLLARVTPQGTVTSAPLSPPRCKEQSQARDMERASDGAVWVADSGCSRLLRIAPDGTTRTVALDADEAPFALAPDAAGGVWFAQVGVPARIGHVDAGGTVTRLRPFSRYGAITDIAYDTLNRTPYVAFGRCALGRVSAGGDIAFLPAPIPARHLAFTPGSIAWLASATRLVTTPLATQSARRCDDTPPKVRLEPAFRRTVTLAQLRRGLRIAVREPATVTATPFYGAGDDGQALFKVLPGQHGGAVTFRVPAARLRGYEHDLAAGRKPELSLYVEVADTDGNIATAGGGGRRVTR